MLSNDIKYKPRETVLTETDIKWFKEQVMMDEEFKRFISKGMNNKNKKMGLMDEGYIVSEFDTEDSFRIRIEENIEERY